MKKINDICPEIFGISAVRYRQLANEGKLPSPKNGLVDFEEATKQYVSYLRDRLENHDDTLTEQRRRKTKAEADMKEMQAAQQRGDLIERSIIADELVKRTLFLKADLLALPRRLAKWPEAKDISLKYLTRLMKVYSSNTGPFAGN
jgi:phage terminase Nu1 subunit (DNA packaging protein)